MERAAIPEVRRSAEDSFAAGFYCAESVVMAIAKAEGIESELLPRIATGFGGGMARTCGDCGAVTGAMMAVGLALGRSARELATALTEFPLFEHRLTLGRAEVATAEQGPTIARAKLTLEIVDQAPGRRECGLD